MSITIIPTPVQTVQTTGTVTTEDNNNKILNEEMSNKLSTIIRQNNEAFNQQEREE